MPQKLRRSWLALVALIPCLAAWTAGAIPNTPSRPLSPRPIPPLAFDQYGVSYGQIGPQPVVEAHFTFRNVSHQTIRIESVSPSCGCLRWHLPGDRREYRPGEAGSLTVRLSTANEQPGPHHYTLTVRTAGPAAQTETLSFRVILPERKVTIDPPEVYFYQLTGAPDERTIYVTDHREGRSSPLRILAAECRSKFVQVEVGQPEPGTGTEQRIPIRLTAAGVVPPGREIAYLKLTTDDLDFPRLAVPVLIEGPARASSPTTEYGPATPAGGVSEIWAILERTRANTPAASDQ